MKVTQSAVVAVLALALGMGALSSCQASRHRMAEAKPGARVICQRCYREMTTYKDRTTNRGHQCPDCQTEMSIYFEDGTRKIKCAKCVPEGLDCDKCLPPHDFEEEGTQYRGG